MEARADATNGEFGDIAVPNVPDLARVTVWSSVSMTEKGRTEI